MSKKLVLVAPGYKTFPPNGWGAVESIVWDYYENIKARETEFDIDVVIVNQRDPNLIIQECNAHSPDVVHIMYDDYIIVAPYLQCGRILYTSHYAYITSPEFQSKYPHYYERIFKLVLQYQRGVDIHVISKDIEDVYKNAGYRGNSRVVCNGAREDKFRYTTMPQKNDRSVYVAKIEMRKCQYKYQTIPSLDFVGNYHDSPFFREHPNYLGEWDKPTLYENLTDYGNLVLLSEGEADPLVVKEALIAGLGVVVSECACANLDLTKDFITVIPNERLRDLNYVYKAIEKNRQVSVEKREEIREYALANFSWRNIVERYVSMAFQT